MKIYTKTGDAGQTGLIGGARIAKSSQRICAVGDVDELNSSLGLARTHSHKNPLGETLEWLQSRLFDLGAELASPNEERKNFRFLRDVDIERLERCIDDQTQLLPPLTNFILPGGSAFAANLHHSRSVCRRAERTVLQLHEVEPLRPEALKFLNRLSDWLFVAARTANMAENVQETDWQKSE